MELWIPIAILAALSQAIRTAIQRHMKGPLGDYGASAIRFIYAIPFAWLWFSLVFYGGGENAFPSFNTWFFVWMTFGAIAQIIFTVFLVKLFSYKNFLVGIAFSKTEVLFAAIIEAIMLSSMINFQFGIAIIFGTIAVVFLSLKGSIFSAKDIYLSLKSYSTFIGLLSAITLAVSVITFRLAVNSLESGDFLFRATTTAAIAVVGQAIVMIVYLMMYRKNALIAVLKLWKPGITAGFFAAITTASWVSSFALYTAAPVRAVGQIELIFSLAITVFVFHQKISRIETFGVLLLIVSILLVVFD